MIIGTNVTGPDFDLEAGIRQGDPLSPLLFAFVTRFLIYRIKQLDDEGNII